LLTTVIDYLFRETDLVLDERVESRVSEIVGVAKKSEASELESIVKSEAETKENVELELEGAQAKASEADNATTELQQKVVLASHLRWPKKGPEEKFSLKPVASKLTDLLGQTMELVPDSFGEEDKTLITASGETISYSTLIIATGARVLKLDEFGVTGADAKNICYLRDVQDAARLVDVIAALKGLGDAVVAAVAACEELVYKAVEEAAAGGAKGGAKVIIEPHCHEGVFGAREKEQLASVEEVATGSAEAPEASVEDAAGAAKEKFSDKAVGAGQDLERSVKSASKDACGEVENLGNKAQSTIDDTGDSLKCNTDKATSFAKDVGKDIAEQEVAVASVKTAEIAAAAEDKASEAEDARGLMKAAIRDPDLVVFLENELLYGESFPVS
jgi:hypothetical protein